MERLNPQWSLVDFKSKQMIHDLKILRRLLMLDKLRCSNFS